MSAPRIRSAILTAFFSAATLLAQEPAETPLAPPQPQATAISQSQLVAGIRDYPASAVRARPPSRVMSCSPSTGMRCR